MIASGSMRSRVLVVVRSDTAAFAIASLDPHRGLEPAVAAHLATTTQPPAHRYLFIGLQHSSTNDEAPAAELL